MADSDGNHIGLKAHAQVATMIIDYTVKGLNPGVTVTRVV